MSWNERQENNKIRLLDLFCGAGGAAMGYYHAGIIDITGIDIHPQPHYPFRFIQGDALDYLTEHGSEYDIIHASPPCQGYSRMKGIVDVTVYPRLIKNVRKTLIATGKPYIIENIVEAVGEDGLSKDSLVLCGTMFGLKTHRHRRFETSPSIYFYPAGCTREKVGFERLNKYFSDPSKMATIIGHNFSLAVGRSALGINWMTRGELAEAIPPAYTEYIGRWMLRELSCAAGRHRRAGTRGAE